MFTLQPERLGMTKHAIAGLGFSIALAACGGSPPLAPTADGFAPTAHRATSGSGDLLYIDQGYVFGGLKAVRGRVSIFEYPSLTYVTQFTVAKSGYPPATTEGMCADANGDVFIEASYYYGTTMLEYAHGGTSAIASLDVAGNMDYTGDCAIDPKSGNLATANTHDIQVFKKAKGKPVTYTDSGMSGYISCTYDTNGNLFIAGTLSAGGAGLAELPSGSSTFTNITLNEKLYPTGKVQWVGKSLVVQSYSALYRISISGSTGTVIGKTRLFGRVTRGEFTDVLGDQVFAPDWNRTTQNAGLWNYPKSGKPVTVFRTEVRHPYSGVLSP